MAFQRLALTHRVQLLMCSCLATESSNPPTVTRNSEPLIYLLPVTEQQANNIKTDLELQIRIISIMRSTIKISFNTKINMLTTLIVIILCLRQGLRSRDVSINLDYLSTISKSANHHYPCGQRISESGRVKELNIKKQAVCYNFPPQWLMSSVTFCCITMAAKCQSSTFKFTRAGMVSQMRTRLSFMSFHQTCRTAARWSGW